MSKDERSTYALEPEERGRLAEFANVLIPGGAGLPSASDVGVADEWIDRVFDANPDLFTPVRFVANLDGATQDRLMELGEHRPAIHRQFVFAVAGAYFMVPAVRKNLGYPGNAPRRKAAPEDEAGFYLEDGVLEPVKTRGAIYRETPE